MDPADRDWWLKQTGEYVQGTLGVADRKVFEKIQSEDADLRRMVAEYEEQLAASPASSNEVKPFASAWHEPTDSVETAQFSDTSAAEEDPLSAIFKESEKTAESQRQLSAVQDDAITNYADTELLRRQQLLAIQQTNRSLSRQVDIWRSVAGLAIAGCLLLGMFSWLTYQEGARGAGASAPKVDVQRDIGSD